MASAEECDGTLAWPLDKAATRNSGHLRPRRWKLERAENVANTALGPKGIVPVPIVWSQVWARRTDYVLKLMAGIQCSGRDIEIDALRSVRKVASPVSACEEVGPTALAGEASVAAALPWGYQLMPSGAEMNHSNETQKGLYGEHLCGACCMLCFVE